MTGLARRLRVVTRPTADEQRRLLRVASGALVRTSARVLRPGRGELERVLRGVPTGRGARRFGVAPAPAELADPPDERPEVVRRRALGALIVAGALGAAGLAKAAPSVRAALEGGIDVLSFDVAPPAPTLADIEASTCGGPPAGPAAAGAVPSAPSAPSGSSGAPPGLSAGTDISGAIAAAGERALAAVAHPNPRLAYTVGGVTGNTSQAGPAGATPDPAGGIAATMPAAGGAPSAGGAAVPAPSASGPGGGGAPLAALPTVPGLDGPATFVATAPMPDPTVAGPVVHDVQAPGRPLPVDTTSASASCPVWPGEPGAPVFAKAGGPPPLHPADIVATAPSVMGIPAAVLAANDPALRSPSPSGPAARPASPAAGGPLAVPQSPSSGMPRPAPSRGAPPVMSAGMPLAGMAGVPAAPSAPSAPSAPAAPSAPSGVGPATPAPPNDATTQAILNQVVFGAGRGAPPPDPADCDPDEPEPSE